MIIRLHTPSSIYRINAEPNEILHDHIASKIGDIKYQAYLGETLLNSNNTLETLNLKNGAIVRVDHEIIEKPVQVKDNKPRTAVTIEDTRKCNHEKTAFCLDCLPSSSPTLEKNKDFCNHAKNAMCSNCAPLSQWDFDFHSKAGIKYLSYESYKLFLKDSAQSLEALDYQKKKCMHGRNEKCINCIDKAIPILVPIYRMVDHVEIGCSESIERLITQFKASGREVFGVLFGREGSYDKIPGGTKVEVKGVFIPEQECYPDGFVLKPEIVSDLFDTKSDYKTKSQTIIALHEILTKYDMKIVGCIYTNFGSVKTSSFVTASEVLFISYLQNKNPHYDSSLNKNFNSKFVTLVLKKSDENIEPHELMISEQGMALTKENMLSLTTDPNIFMADKHVFSYKKMNEYDIALRTEDSSLPVDYLIVRLTHGYKHNPVFNNESFDYRWKDKKASKYFAGDYSLQKFNNLDVLIWLKINDKLKSMYESFLKVIINRDEDEFAVRSKSNEFERFICEMRGDEIEWACENCTYLNHNSVGICEMCETPMD